MIGALLILVAGVAVICAVRWARWRLLDDRPNDRGGSWFE